MTNGKLSIYVLSDSLGETAEQVAKAAVSQYSDVSVKYKRFSYVNNMEIINSVVEEAKSTCSMIMFTIVIPQLRDYLISKCMESKVQCVDLINHVIDAIGIATNKKPDNTAGVIRQLNEEYFEKVAAMEFAVKYDDGKDPNGVLKADVVLIGVSRTSKTPLCMYLATKNYKATNIPLVPEVAAPEELFQINPRKIIGLTNSPTKLFAIRQERLKALGLSQDANYANLERIMKEIEYAEDIMKKIGCPIIDVTAKAIEETAGIITNMIREMK